ncbi:MAG TPA: hypothetical protein PKY59_15625 [Pyrinomonadaceae bacterium]|nr:hypothetical protein [Pyrinomonadaceae bacterium]
MDDSNQNKTCTKCGCEKPLTEFSFRYKEKGKRHPWCRPCTREHNMNRYYANHEHYRKHHTELTKNKRREKTRKVLEYLLEHPCVDCGESDPIVLEFDHRDDEKKIKPVTIMIGQNVGLDKIFKEIEKCDVRCANCHRRRTGAKRGYTRDSLLREINEE